LFLALYTKSDPVSGFVGTVFVLGFLAFVVAAAVWFFRGPATASEKYVDGLALTLQNPNDAALFRQIYQTKGPKSTTLAWLLSLFLSPTISYVYQGKWALAVISFLTLQGLFIWYFVALFTMPFEVLAGNKKLADEAFQQVSLRGYGPGQGQQIIIHQQAYLPHPGYAPAPAPSAEAYKNGEPGYAVPPVPPAPPAVQDVNGTTAPPQPGTVRIIADTPVSGPPATTPDPTVMHPPAT
jgi:hypothetical protein